ncbi:hypothetical protein [Sphingobium sp. Leaf26]|uniref:hypothetical protein n=1 Tax=Sphingobium sp. Leaf26 TaxID=1735693 RepID=UPI0012E2A967|nr:hypothetical protein [Sphingobium sp. Leaf26]
MGAVKGAQHYKIGAHGEHDGDMIILAYPAIRTDWNVDAGFLVRGCARLRHITYGKLFITRTAGMATATFKISEIIGAVIGTKAINRSMTRLLMIALVGLSAAGAPMLAVTTCLPCPGTASIIALPALESAMLGVVRTALYRVAVHVFPPRLAQQVSASLLVSDIWVPSPVPRPERSR